MTRMTVAGVEAGRRHRLLHLDDRLKQLGVEPHLLLGQLALGDVELGAEVAGLASLPVAQRLPGAGAPADLSAAGNHPVLLVAERAALRQPRPFGHQRGPVVGVDVLQEFLVLEVFRGVTGEPLEGGIDEREPQVHVVRDHALAHAGRDGAQLAQRRALVPLRPPPPAPLEQPERRARPAAPAPTAAAAAGVS